ncbi:hypothetical protein K7X08_022151 [Anisodus acutangulus]|uniref:Uncharacterized protein n=1 Tax=Anisodus acutangulus TaxID=402998 RepID=A0A9Q1L5F3_9SOLA|nr:hypothetical protein K7X08_022151 [Anisodus acutangulus]
MNLTERIHSNLRKNNQIYIKNRMGIRLSEKFMSFFDSGGGGVGMGRVCEHKGMDSGTLSSDSSFSLYGTAIASVKTPISYRYKVSGNISSILSGALPELHPYNLNSYEPESFRSILSGELQELEFSDLFSPASYRS